MATSAVKVGEKVNIPAKQETPQMTMKDWINKSQFAISKALPSAITPERFTRMATTAVTMNPDLGACTPSSFIGAMLQAAALGLEPNTPLGQAYLIPYDRYDKKSRRSLCKMGKKCCRKLCDEQDCTSTSIKVTRIYA